MIDKLLIFIEDFGNFLTSSEFLFFLDILRVVVILLSLAILIRIVVLIMKSGYFSGVRKRYGWYFPGDMIPPKQKNKEAWQKIKNSLYKSGKNNKQFVGINADDFLISIFSRLGLVSDVLEDQFQELGESRLRNISEVIRAHTLISGLRYDENAFLSYDDAERIIFIYEEALKELSVIDNL